MIELDRLVVFMASKAAEEEIDFTASFNAEPYMLIMTFGSGGTVMVYEYSGSRRFNIIMDTKGEITFYESDLCAEGMADKIWGWFSVID